MESLEQDLINKTAESEESEYSHKLDCIRICQNKIGKTEKISQTIYRDIQNLFMILHYSGITGGYNPTENVFIANINENHTIYIFPNEVVEYTKIPKTHKGIFKKPSREKTKHILISLQ